MCLAFWHPLLFYSSSCLLHPTYLYLSPNLYLPFLPFWVLHLDFLFELHLILGTYLEPDELDECSLFALQLYQVWVYTRYTSDGLAFLVLLTTPKCSRLQVKTHHTVRYSIHFKPSRLTSMACFKSPVSLTCYLWFVGGSSQRALTRAHEEHENSTQGSNQELSCRWATGLTTTTPRSFVF